MVYGGKKMSSVVVVGSQWGDEGKGKITDFLSKEAEVIARMILQAYLAVFQIWIE